MIHPTKHIPAEQTLLGAGVVIFSQLPQPRSVTSLWEAVRKDKAIGTFERFILALTMLYSLRAVRFEGGLVIRRTP